MQAPSFEGIWVPLITPYRNHAVDFPALQKLAHTLVSAGIHGLVVGGTTGEPATWQDGEGLQILDAVLEAVAGRIPVIFGLGGNDTASAIRQLPVLASRPVAGLLSVVPYYTRPAQAGIAAHFRAIASATALPLVLYNIPYRTGVNLELATLQSLSTVANIVAIKESGGNLTQLMDFIEHTRFAVLSGEDHLIFTTLALGGRGAIAAAAHLHPGHFVCLYQAMRDGQWALARNIARALRPLIENLFSEPNPGPIKAALAQAGLVAEELRLPMTPVNSACRDRVWQAFEAVPPLEEIRRWPPAASDGREILRQSATAACP